MEVALFVVIGSLLLLMLVAVVVLLLVVNTNRRNRHRAELAEVGVRHVQELRQVEQEVQRHTLTEVGRDLHDNIGQLLAVARMGVSRQLVAAPEDPLASGLKNTLDDTIFEVRRLSQVLNADQWRGGTLVNAVRQEAERVRRIGGLEVVLDLPEAEVQLEPDQEIVLFRLFQEALNNALKHARAARLSVELSAAPHVVLRVIDDGAGFDPERTAGGGQGLLNMQRRAALIGYHCHVASRPGQGTVVVLSPA